MRVVKKRINGREIITIKARGKCVPGDSTYAMRTTRAQILTEVEKHIKYGIKDIDGEDYLCGYIRIVGGAADADTTP